ncbi:caspase family protein [Actinosynnema sp. NPDC023658]|uniref:caspase, EACC1-associated type n=1 Tax=Actinosynnema sp. NPDC023658 TaxID=3155465 RepID=UPI0033F66793
MGRFALLIGSGRYDDAALRPLSAPAWDVDALSRVLGDPVVGGFEVVRLVDRSVQELRVAVEDFLMDRARDDFVLVYLTGHGVLDKRGRLVFAATDTGTTRLSATALSAAWLNELLADCMADSRVLVLDCCFSGAHGRTKAGADSVAAQLGEVGSGHAVLTASRDWEFSFEGDASGGSVFTTGLVEGLRTGDADLDGDGLITVEEAHTYAAGYVRDQGAQQHPQRWLTAAEGELVLAHSPRGPRLASRTVPMHASREAHQLHLERRSALVASQAQALRPRDPELARAVVLAAIRDLAPSRAAVLTLWGMTVEPETGRLPLGHGGLVVEMAWSGENNHLMSIGRDGSVCEWNADGTLVASTSIPVDFHGASLSRNARSLLLGEGSGSVSLWHVDGMRYLARSQSMSSLAGSHQWSNDGMRLFDGDYTRADAVIWSIQAAAGDVRSIDAQPVAAPRGFTPYWSPDDRLLAFLDEHSVTVVHADSGNVATVVRTSEKPSDLTWSPDSAKVCLLIPEELESEWASFGRDNRYRVVIYDLAGQLLAEREATGVASLEWSPTDKRIAVMLAGPAREAEVHIWNAQALTDMDVLVTERSGVSLVGNVLLRWSHDGRYLAFAHWTSVFIWDPEHGVVHQSHSGDLMAFDWAPDKTQAVVSASGRNSLTVIDPNVGVTAELKDDRLTGKALSWSPTGQQIAVSSRDGVLLWPPSGGDPTTALTGMPDMVMHAVWSPNGHRLAVAAHAFFENSPNRVAICTPDDQRGIVEMAGDDTQHGPLAWSPDSTLLLGTEGPGSVVIWSAVTGHHEQYFDGSIPATAVCWPTAHPHLITVADGEHRIRVLDRQTEREVAVCIGHTGDIRRLTWSPDGEILASSSHDETVRLWNGTTGECLVELDAPHDARSLTWSDDASRLTLVSRDNKMVTWILPQHLDDVLDSVDEERALTNEERMRYGLEL